MKLLLPFLFLILFLPLFGQTPADSLVETRYTPLSDTRWFDLNFRLDEFGVWLADTRDQTAAVFAPDLHKRDVCLSITLHPNGRPEYRIDATPGYSEAERKAIDKKLRKLPVIRPKWSACSIRLDLRVNGGLSGDWPDLPTVDPEDAEMRTFAGMSLSDKRKTLDRWSTREALPELSMARKITWADQPGLERFEDFLRRNLHSRDLFERLDRQPDFWALDQVQSNDPQLAVTTRILLLIARGHYEYARDYLTTLVLVSGPPPSTALSGVLFQKAYRYMKLMLDDVYALQQSIPLGPEPDETKERARLMKLLRRGYPENLLAMYLREQERLDIEQPMSRITSQTAEARSKLYSVYPLSSARFVALDPRSDFENDCRKALTDIHPVQDSLGVYLHRKAALMVDLGDDAFAVHLCRSMLRFEHSKQDSLIIGYCLNRLGISQTYATPEELAGVEQMTRLRMRDSASLELWDAYSPAAVMALRMGQFLLNSPREASADAFFEKARVAGIPEAGFHLGVLKLSRGDRGHALPLLDEFVARADSLRASATPQRTDLAARAEAMLGLIAYEQGDSEKAFLHMNRSVEWKPTPEFYRSRAMLSTNYHRNADALADYDRIVQAGEAGVADYLGRGDADFELGYFGAAISDYSRVLSADSTNLHALDGRMNAYSRIREYELALEDADAALRIQPDDIAMIYFRGMLLLMKGDSEAAETDFALVLKIEPENTRALTQHARTLINLNRTEEAMSEIDKAIDLSPTDSDPYSVLASLLCQLGRYDAAIDVYRRILDRIDSRDIPVMLSLAELQVITGRTDSARATLRSALQIQHDSAQEAIIHYLDMAAGRMAGVDYSGGEKIWNELLDKRPDLGWWSFTLFERWLDEGSLDPGVRNDLRAWTDRMKPFAAPTP
jgi:tetratricopeptide (TPR) repeat protein